MPSRIRTLVFACLLGSASIATGEETIQWVRPGTVSVDDYLNEFIRDALKCVAQTRWLEGWERRLHTMECMERAGYIEINNGIKRD